jgi:hypothetical protein
MMIPGRLEMAALRLFAAVWLFVVILSVATACSSPKQVARVSNPCTQPARFLLAIDSADGKHHEEMNFGEVYRDGEITSYDRASGEYRTLGVNMILNCLESCGDRYKRRTNQSP